MAPYEQIESILIHRQDDWWDKILRFIPELSALEAVTQPRIYHAEGSAGVHTRLAVEACPEDDDPDLLWAALFHDIGKAKTSGKSGGWVTFHGHHDIGAAMALVILDRLEMPAHRRDRIVWAVKHHMFHMSWNLTSPEQCSKKHRKFICDRRFPFLLNLVRVDAEASWGKDTQKMDAWKFYTDLRERFIGNQQNV